MQLKIPTTPMVTALTAVFSFTSNADTLSGRIVTGCWKANSIMIQVRDIVIPSAPSSSETFSPVYDSTPCVDVEFQVFSGSKNYLRIMTGSPSAQLGHDMVSDDFCCLTLKEVAQLNDPMYADVPFINLGDGNKNTKLPPWDASNN